MDGRLLLILCLGLLQAYVPGSMVNGQGPVAPVAEPPKPPKKDWCIIRFNCSANVSTVLTEDEIQQYPEIIGCQILVDKSGIIYCNVASKKVSDCKPDDITFNTIPDNGHWWDRHLVANWFLEFHICIWRFPYTTINKQIEWVGKHMRATAQHLEYTELKGCRYENRHWGAVCTIEPNMPCDWKSVKFEAIAAMETNGTCDDGCVERMLESYANRFKFCILKFKFDESTSSVTFMGIPSREDYKKIPELSNFTDCSFYPSDQKNIFFCRSNDSSNCTEEYRKTNINLNFFDKLNLGKEVTSKMLHSVLASDICLWRFSNELDEYKVVHFADLGNRLTEYEYREKIDFCVNDKRKKTITCRIADKPCESSSIQDFQFSAKLFQELEAKSQEKVSKFRRARNRFGPCIAHFNQENCNLKGLSIEHFYFPIDAHHAPCLVTPNLESFECLLTYEQIHNAIDKMIDEYKCNPSIKPCTEIHRTAEFGKVDDLEKKWKELTGGAEELKTKQEIYHVIMNLKYDETLKICNVIDSTVKFAGDCVLAINGLITCGIPLGKECSPNYFTNGPGLDALMTIPTLSTCSKQEIQDTLDDMWLNLDRIDTKKSGDSYDKTKVIWEIATTTTIDPYAFINNPSINSSGEIMYPPVEIEFKDPPSKEEIKARREALTGRKNETKENNMGKRLSVLSWSVLLPLQFFFL